jgi:hypothetical protein
LPSLREPPAASAATPDDVARAVAFLADPEQSSFVNGHTLSVDGGWYGDGGWESPRRSKQGLQDLVPTSGAESGYSLLTRRARGSP